MNHVELSLAGQWPMVDVHRHLGGSTNVDFIMHAMEKGACSKQTREDVIRQMVCHPNEEYHNMFELFLQKFRILDKINWTEELVADNIRYVCEDINKENVDAVFMDFSVSKYRHIGWSLAQAINFICNRFDEYSHIPIIPILSIKYESPEEAQQKIAKIIDDPVGDKICGIDFVGDESKFNPKIQSKICEMWKGRFVRLHIGESGPIDNIIKTFSFPGVTNIAHGIKIIDDYELGMYVTHDYEYTFDIAPTSNYVTGVVKNDSIHPAVQMHRNNIKLTLGSDDPVQLQTNLHNECKVLLEHGITASELLNILNRGQEQYLKWESFARCITKRT